MDGEEEEQEQKSRSQIKRELHELKDLGEELTELSPAQLEAVPLSKRTRDEILAAQSMTRSALQRQLRYLVRLIEEEDVDAIRTALSGPLRPPKKVADLHEAERWRDELIDGDDEVLYQFVEEHPEFDRQRLRQLAMKARRERERGKPPKSARQLFEYLKELSSSST